ETTSLTHKKVNVATEVLIELSQYRRQSLEEEDTDDEEDIDDEDDIDDEVASTPLLQVSQSHQKQSRKREEKSDKNQPKRVKKQNIMKININDFSKETLRSIEDIFGDNEKQIFKLQFSRLPMNPMETNIYLLEDSEQTKRTSLMSSDVDKDQSRLMLSKEQVNEKMLPFLEESEDPVKGFVVKVWNGDKTHVLTSGWNDVWMFRHIKNRKICFAIEYVSFPVKKILSR
ncbi:hypothetical protein ARALYDRAFT_473790, partial [Arabidopsis lyrata subsp. lyrata]